MSQAYIPTTTHTQQQQTHQLLQMYTHRNPLEIQTQVTTHIDMDMGYTYDNNILIRSHVIEKGSKGVPLSSNFLPANE